MLKSDATLKVGVLGATRINGVRCRLQTVVIRGTRMGNLSQLGNVAFLHQLQCLVVDISGCHTGEEQSVRRRDGRKQLHLLSLVVQDLRLHAKKPSQP